MTLRWLLVLRTENPYANISGYFPDCTGSEYSAQPAMPPFLNLHTQKNILENLHRSFKYGVLDIMIICNTIFLRRLYCSFFILLQTIGGGV